MFKINLKHKPWNLKIRFFPLIKCVYLHSEHARLKCQCHGAQIMWLLLRYSLVLCISRWSELARYIQISLWAEQRSRTALRSRNLFSEPPHTIMSFALPPAMRRLLISLAGDVKWLPHGSEIITRAAPPSLLWTKKRFISRSNGRYASSSHTSLAAQELGNSPNGEYISSLFSPL